MSDKNLHKDSAGDRTKTADEHLMEALEKDTEDLKRRGPEHVGSEGVAEDTADYRKEREPDKKPEPPTTRIGKPAEFKPRPRPV